MKILITGYKGLVGRHFTKRLFRHNLTLIDIKDGNDAGEFFRNNNDRFDLVIHAAATVGGRKTIDLEPHRLFNNFVLDSEFIQWCLKTKPEKVIAFSSSAAYPMAYQMAEPLILSESDINLDYVLNPDPSVYGWSKITIEQLIRYSGLDNVWTFRPFSGYSEKQSLDYPFPSFISRAVRKDDPFEIWGDGNQVRDWIHMNDIVEGALTIIDNAPADVYNLCTGRPISFNEFANILCEKRGYSPAFHHLVNNPVGVQYRVGDPIKMNKFYTAEISLEEGINRALKNML